MIIITSFYYHSHPSRLEELKHSLKQNLDKRFVSEIHLYITPNDKNQLLEDKYFDDLSKIHFIEKDQQPTYKDFVMHAISLENAVCMITNSDIELESIDEFLIDRLKTEHIAFALTRHESDGTKKLIDRYNGSHDSFVFYSDNLKESILVETDISSIDIIQNRAGSEAIMVMFLIDQLGYTLFNPCFQFKIIHHHASNVRVRGKPLAYTSVRKLNMNTIWCKHMIYPKNIEPVIKNEPIVKDETTTIKDEPTI